jgi:hypothetical protein
LYYVKIQISNSDISSLPAGIFSYLGNGADKDNDDGNGRLRWWCS